MRPSLAQLAIVFTRYANLTLGSGSATAATMHRELVVKRKWLTEDQFTIASAGLLLAAVIPLARDGLTDWLTVIIAVVTVVLLLVSEIDTLWIVLGAAAASLAAFLGP